MLSTAFAHTVILALTNVGTESADVKVCFSHVHAHTIIHYGSPSDNFWEFATIQPGETTKLNFKSSPRIDIAIENFLKRDKNSFELTAAIDAIMTLHSDSYDGKNITARSYVTFELSRQNLLDPQYEIPVDFKVVTAVTKEITPVAFRCTVLDGKAVPLGLIGNYLGADESVGLFVVGTQRSSWVVSMVSS